MVDPVRDGPLMEETVRVEPVIVWKYPVVVDSVGTLTDDRTVREEVTWASCEVRKLDWIVLVVMVDSESDVPLIDETVRVDPVIVWKYPVVVESVGTLMDDRTVREEVTCASWVNKKLDWIVLVVMVDSESDVPLIEETVKVDPVIVWKYPVVVESVGTWMDDRTVREEVM